MRISILVLLTGCFVLQSFASHIRIGGPRTTVNVVESLLDVWTMSQRGVTGEYIGMASAAVHARLWENTVDAAIADLVAPASDALLTPDAVQFPLWARPMVPVYNVPGLEGLPIVFSATTIARIYKGNLTRWDDPELKALNPSITLPAEEISFVCTLSLRGGLNDATTLYLTTVDEEWRNTVGYRQNLNWPAFSPARFKMANSPALMTETLLTTPYSFGLQQLDFALGLGLQYGHMVNRRGKLVEPTPSSVTFAILETGAQGVRFNAQPLNSMDANSVEAWPIVTWNYLVLRKRAFRETCALKAATVQFFKWILETKVGVETAAGHMVVVLPSLLDDLLGVSQALGRDILCDERTVAEALQLTELT